MNPARILLLTLCLSPAVAASALAYDPIPWRSIDGGGAAFATAGGFRLGGTIGQPDAGTLAGGAYTLRGGFWTGGASRPVGVPDDPALAFRLFPTRPNPVRSSSRVAFDLPRPTRVVLSLFDAAGRIVRRWDYGLLPAGHQDRAWGAADEGGRGLASGVYFLRLDAGRDRAVHKVIVLR